MRLRARRPTVCGFGTSARRIDADRIVFSSTATDPNQPLDPELKNLNAWFQRMDARPSAKASLHPAHEQVQMKG